MAHLGRGDRQICPILTSVQTKATELHSLWIWRIHLCIWCCHSGSDPCYGLRAERISLSVNFTPHWALKPRQKPLCAGQCAVPRILRSWGALRGVRFMKCGNLTGTLTAAIVAIAATMTLFNQGDSMTDKDRVTMIEEQCEHIIALCETYGGWPTWRRR